jgi:arginase
MLGGDHSWRSARSRPWRATAARRVKKLRVLWFDAHADFNTATLTPSGNIHGMPVACLCGHGPSP